MTTNTAQPYHVIEYMYPIILQHFGVAALATYGSTSGLIQVHNIANFRLDRISIRYALTNNAPQHIIFSPSEVNSYTRIIVLGY